MKEKINLSELYQYSIFDQGETMMCVATSVLTAIEYLNQVKGNSFKSYSRLYTYFYGRLEYGRPKQLCGLKIESVIASLQDYGMVQDRILNDDLIHLNSDIDENVVDCKKIPKNIIHHQIELSDEVFKSKISLHIPIICILRCTLEELSFSRRIIKNRVKNGQKFSHCVCIIGYDDVEEVFIFQNSQGKSWQFEGFGKISYNAMNKIVKAVTIEDFNV